VALSYSNKQTKIIEENSKNLRIIACAGSGKTRTVVGKINYLLLKEEALKLNPENILAFTYTEKAANELKSRVVKDLNNQLDGLADMYIGTIHGWCLQKIQYYRSEYQKYSVLDEIKLKIFVDKHYDKIGMKNVFKSSNAQPMRRFLDTSIFLNIMNHLREFELNKDSIPENLQQALAQYSKQLKSKRYFDFSMILTETLSELKNENSDLSSYIKENIKYLFVDEYQDINPIQNNIIQQIQKISNCKLIVVGDDDQNIYQWRGSDNKYIINFDKQYKELEVESFSLEDNYRSSEGIVKLASTLIENNQNRILNKPSMNSIGNQKYIKNEDILFKEFNTIEEESENIAKYILDIRGVAFSDNDEKNRGLDYSDICVLIRKWDKAKSISEVFDKYDIPYITSGVNELFNTSEIKAAVGIFQFLHGIIDKNELKNLWIDTFISKKLSNKFDNYKFDQAIIAIYNSFKEFEKPSKNGKINRAFSLQGIFWDFLNIADINEELFIDRDNPTPHVHSEIILFNLGKFSQVINDFEEINFNSSVASFHLFSFLSFIKYVAVDYYPEGWISSNYKTPNAIQIMTIHQSKGLEFPVIILPGMNQNYFPAKKKGGISEKHFMPEILHNNIIEFQKATTTEDERRLLYVAITRSQKYLLITRAPDLNNRLYKKRSSFLAELPKSNRIIEPFSIETTFNNKDKVPPTHKERLEDIQIDFTTLKDFFDCPYRFKLVTLYGFCTPLNQRMGLGKSFHNCLMDFHKRIKDGEQFSNPKELLRLIQEQEFFPYIGGSRKLRVKMHKIIRNNVYDYFMENINEGKNIEFIEQDIQYKIDDNIIIIGRIDLIKKIKENDQYETTIIEFKSKDDNQTSRITPEQLKMYALGHKELTGEQADYIMTYVIGENKQGFPIPITDKDLDGIANQIKDATKRIKDSDFTYQTQEKKENCEDCYQNRLCIKQKEYNVKSKK